jgi:thiamine-monophosphate kinase
MRPDDSPAIGQLGENRLVARFRTLASAGPDRGVVVGSGDDTAVLNVADRRLLLLTCDMMVENVHFRLDWARPDQIGWKAMAQNLSDIAAMGGEPAFAVASLAAPGNAPEEVAEGITRGLVSAAAEYGAALVGGDLVGSPGPVVLDVALAGWVEREVMLLRRGARPGDAVCVTGSLGASAAGLAALQRGRADQDAPELQRALKAHHEPRPRVLEGQAIAATQRATAMMDLSDGLAEDLPRLCAESGLAARVFADRIPIDPSCTTLAGRLGLDPLSLAASGGEDYELLFTCPQDAVDEIAAAVAARTEAVVSVVGETSPGKGVVLVDAEGKAHEFARGFDHFAAPDSCAEDHGP